MYPDAVRPLLERTALPRGFLWGVATAGYQVEGGFNDGRGPDNNWASWEASGRVQTSLAACDFWERPELLLDAAAAAGANAFRMSLEWARVQPEPGTADAAALAGYGDILAACHRRRLAPVVTLWDTTHPVWLGPEPWLREPDDTVRRFAGYAANTARDLGRRLATRGLTPPWLWITVSEPNTLALAAYVRGAYPPGRRAALREAEEVLDVLGACHVAAYDALHAVYAAEGWRRPLVTLANAASAVYEHDWLLVDVLMARQRNIRLARLDDDLTQRRALWSETARRIPRLRPGLDWTERAVAALATRTAGAGLPRTRAAVYASESDRHIDAVAIAYEDPHPQDCLPTLGAGLPCTPPWEIPVNPVGLLWQLRAAADCDLPVYVVRSGLALHSGGAVAPPRPDGVDRPAFLRGDVLAVLRALDEGVPVRGYLHWSVADAYSWGSYRPAYGLHSVEREAPGAPPLGLSPLDAAGEDAAGAYRRIVAALSSGSLADRMAVLCPD